MIGDVLDEGTCDKLCQDEETCSVYTYHPANNPTLPETCYLLTTIQGPIRECEGDTCVTGLPNCEGNVCAYVDEGMMLPQGVLITDGGEKNIELLTLGVCPQTVAIAIGGGGYGDFGAGGGRCLLDSMII